MSKVDWSLAPEGATHKVPTGCWYKIEGRQVYCWSSAGTWAGPYSIRQYQDGSIDEMVKRPTVKPWSGPEDGLPPVGTKCLVVKVDGIDAPLDAECKIVAHEMNGENMVAVYMHGKPYEMYAGIGLSHCFSLIKELDARETAIREIMDVADVDCRVTAARLVDAGFKLEVV